MSLKQWVTQCYLEGSRELKNGRNSVGKGLWEEIAEQQTLNICKHTETTESLLQGYCTKEGTECHGGEGVS